MVAFRWGSATSDQGGERRGGHVHPWMARRQTVGMAKFAPLIERRRTQGRRRENVGWGFAKQIYIYIYILSVPWPRTFIGIFFLNICEFVAFSRWISAEVLQKKSEI